MEPPYDFEVEKIAKYVKEKRYSLVLLQLPDGMKRYAAELVDALRDATGAEFYVHGEPCWGPCVVPIEEAKSLGVQLIVHYGHRPRGYAALLPREPEVIFVPASLRSPGLSEHLVEQLVSELRARECSKPVLITTAQHDWLLPRLVERLAAEDLEPVMRGAIEHSVLGCDYGPLIELRGAYQCVVVLASGVFHALGAALSTDVPTLQVDPIEEKVIDLASMKRTWLRRRYAKIIASLKAERWALWAGSPPGQHRRELILKLADLIRAKKLKYYLFYSRNVSSAELLNADSPQIDVHVVTSCPRVPIDDFTLQEFHKPVLSPGEALMVLTGDLERYRFPW
ncbi:MAG: diphthamide biosynthesis enzyme Dph2 [Fervidicoccaceae archaeon]